MKLDTEGEFGFFGLRDFCLAHGLISIIGFISVNIFRRQPFQDVNAAKYFGTINRSLARWWRHFTIAPPCWSAGR